MVEIAVMKFSFAIWVKFSLESPRPEFELELEN